MLRTKVAPVFTELESGVEGRAVAWAKLHYIKALKFTPAGTVGYPDRMFWLGPFIAFIEFKRVGEALRPTQVERIAELRADGHTVGVFDDSDDAIRFLESTLLSERWRKEHAEAGMLWSLVQARVGKDVSGLHGVSHPSRKRVRR